MNADIADIVVSSERRLRSDIPSRLLRALLSAPVLFALGVASAQHPLPIGRTLDEFERDTGITSWPGRSGCSYRRPFTDSVVGLELRGGGELMAPRYGGCHSLEWHLIVNWPKDLPSGTYLVAATVDTDPKTQMSSRLPPLRITGIFRHAPADEAAVAEAHRRTCTADPDARECGR